MWMTCGSKFIQNVEELQRDAAGERSAPECGSVHAAADGRGGSFIRGDNAERNAASHRFRRDHNVRQNYGLEHLIREVGSGAADAALNFVENEQSIVTIGQLARRADVVGGERIDAAFALDQLKDDGGGTIAGDLSQSGDVVARDEVYAG